MLPPAIDSTYGGTENGPTVANFSLSNHLYAGGSKSVGSNLSPSGPHLTYEAASALQPLVGPSSSSLFTDVVVNLNNDQQFIHYSKDGFDFPSSAALLEAARGNLDSPERATAAGVDLAALRISPKVGYKNFYLKAAKSQLQPLDSINTATLNFLSEIVHLANVHFGLVAFNDSTGFSPADTVNSPDVSTLYPTGNSSSHPLPNISLNTSPNYQDNNYASVSSIIPSLDPFGERNTAQGLKAAIDQLSNHPRIGTKKAIVLITDGMPTKDLSGAINPTTAAADAINQAYRAKNLGISVFCVAVACSDKEIAKENALYNDTANGIAAISANGARYYRVDYTNPADTQAKLTGAFANLCRQLVQLAR
ncbi:MAG: hypothetical protein C5B53_00590 [Candidatus Melainabacteria bacterium]|nr:MAG: hypothetical protein C5B53_00590 [Candidatus Melainabacteria bacterium]